jgi:AcrR family transcriptional regulator
MLKQLAMNMEKQRTERTRERILAHAGRVFAERGFRKVTVGELCADLGMSKRTFYRYFPNRDALVDTLLTDRLSANLPLILENLSSGKPVDTILRTHFDLLINRLFVNVSTQMMADVQILMPAIWERIEQFRSHVAGIITELLRRGQRDRTVRLEIDPAVTGKLIQGIVTNLANPRFLLAQDISIGQFVANFQNLLLNGVLVPQAKEGGQ